MLLPAFVGAYVVAFLLRFDGALSAEFLQVLLRSLPWVLAAKLTAAAWFHIYHGWNRYVTFHDLGAITKAITCGSIGITLVDALVVSGLAIPRSVILLDWGVTLLFVGAQRAAPRVWKSLRLHWHHANAGLPVLIVGADDSGEALLRAINQNSKLNYSVIGFVDDRSWLRAQRIAGVPVLGTLADLPQLVAKYQIKEVLIHSGELPGKAVRELVEIAQQREFRVTMLPSYEQLLAGQVSVQPRPVAIDDLLRRESVSIDNRAIREWLGGRTVLVTGSSGSIGSEICRQLLALSPSSLVVVDRSETGQFFLERELRRLAPSAQIEVVMADLTDGKRLESIFQRYRPEIVFHAAAYKHVPLMEEHPGEAIKNIALATRNLVDLADKYAASTLVMISTDKAVNPTSVMGSCKQLAERYVQAKATSSDCQFVTVRFGNVLDSAGSVVPLFREQISHGGPVTVTHPEMLRYFMMIPEAAKLVVQAGAMGQGGEIFVLDMGEPVKISDLARDMIRLSGLREGEDIEIEFTGLRPGEKLFEELYGEQEKHRATSHPKIRVADSQGWNLLQTINDLRHLEDLVNDSPANIRTALAEVVPLYSSEEVELKRAA